MSNNSRFIYYCMIILIALKPIVDMFYRTRWMDGALLAGEILLAIFLCNKHRYKLDKVDVIPLIWFMLFVFSLALSGSNTDWISWIKLMSIFPVYYVGKYLPVAEDAKTIRILQWSLLAVLLCNIVALVLGVGYIEWAQQAQTFAGLYYFKTDLALAMAQVILIMLISKPLKWFYVCAAVVASCIALITNSRIYFAIIFILWVVCLGWEHWKNTKIKFSHIAVLGIVIIGLSVVLLVILAKIPFFRERNFISFTTEGSFRDMMIYNLMYRNIIWADTMDWYLKGDWIHILFGNGVSMLRPWYDAHSLYTTAIYQFGIVGVLLLLALIIWAWNIIRDRADGPIYYLNIGLWIVFLVAGVSYTTAESTQYTWVIAFLVGALSARTSVIGKTKTEC